MVEVFLQYRIRGPPTSVNLIDKNCEGAVRAVPSLRRGRSLMARRRSYKLRDASSTLAASTSPNVYAVCRAFV